MSFAAWIQKVMKFNQEFAPDTLERFFGMEGLAMMEQDDEVVVALGVRASSNALLKPLTAINIGVETNAKPGTVVRIAFRAIRMKDDCQTVSRDMSQLDHNGITLSAVMLDRPLEYHPTGRTSPERHRPSYVREIFGCQEDKELVKKKCTEIAQRIVAQYSDGLEAASSSLGPRKKFRNNRYQMKVAAECLQRLVQQIFDEEVQTHGAPASSTARRTSSTPSALV